MAATVTDITTRTPRLGRVVAAMIGHDLDVTYHFAALGVWYRTRAVPGFAWYIDRVDEHGTEQASVTVRSNTLGTYFGFRRWVLLDDTNRVLDDTDSLEAILASALVEVHG